VPVGEEAVPYLQTITAEITAPLLRASGIPTFLDGVYIEIPTGSFIVAEVCSGARFLITSLVLGTLVSNLFFRTWPRRLIFMALCLVVPILANGLRAYGIVLLAHLSDNAIAIAVDHVIYGLIFLSFVLLILTGLGALFRDRWMGDETPDPAPQGAPTRVSTSVGATLLGAMILFGGSYWTKQVTAPPESAAINIAAVTPSANWKVSEPPAAGWSPSFPGADMQLLRSYTNASGEVSFFIGHYRYQRDGHEVIAVTNTFSGGTGDDQVTRFEKFEVEVGSERKTVRETFVKSPRGSRLIWSWYEIGGTATISPFTGKFLEVWHALSGGSRSATAYAVSTEAGDDVRQPRARLGAFLAAIEATRDTLATAPRTSTQIADSDTGNSATSTTTKER
jgi:EpsI family protein